MAKRRRERDKPKAGPDALYNPNKRVLLSYASDDEEDVKDSTKLSSPDTTVAVHSDAHVANYQMDEYPDDEEADVVVGALSTEDAASEIRDIVEEVSIEAAVQPASKSEGSSGCVRKTYSTGQPPGLGLVSYQYDESDPDEEYDSATEEAMAYLKAVRSERQAMPDILTANGQVDILPEGDNEADDLEGDYDEDDGYYLEDGGYVGAPNSDPTLDDDLTDPQRAFTIALRTRFRAHHELLHLPTTAEAVAALGENCPISFPSDNNKAYAEWHRLLSSKPPELAQIRSLDQATCFDLLALLQKHFLLKGKNIKNNTSAWLWSLLARLDEVGNMTNDQVYPLRELGKHAVFLQYCLLSPEVAIQLEAVGQLGSTMPEVSSREHVGDAALPQRVNLPKDHITDNTLATLDIIMVIVGEVFGQRDLLEFRQPWATAD